VISPRGGGSPAFEPAGATVAGRRFPPASAPRGFRYVPELGIVLHEDASAARVHASPAPDDWVGEARGIKTPGGDYLVMFAGGRAHYHSAHRSGAGKANDMLAYRSTDGGDTWAGPVRAWEAGACCSCCARRRGTSGRRAATTTG
jgi:hypothetical protein